MTDSSIKPVFAAGTTVKYLRQVSNYRADDGWTLTAYLIGPESRLVKVATPVGSDFEVVLGMADTQALLPGVYKYAERLTNGTEAVEWSQGVVQVTADVSVMQAGENMTADERLLVAVDKVLAGRIDADVESYSIKDRALTKIPFIELVKFRSKLAQKVAIARRGLGAYMGGGLAVTFTGTGNER